MLTIGGALTQNGFSLPEQLTNRCCHSKVKNGQPVF